MNNFAFAKIGKSIKFLKNRYSPIGGDNEPSCVLRALANHNPDKTFYLVGRSDFSKLSDNERFDLFPYDNVIDIWKDINIPRNNLDGDDGYKYYNHPQQYFEKNNIKIDYAIFMIGQIGTVTIPGKTEQVRNRSLIASVIDMTKWYSTPILHWMNSTDVPVLEIINDPRYDLSAARDIMRAPTITLSQYDYTYTKRHFTSFDDQDLIETPVKAKYAGMEKSFCIDYDKPTINSDRNIPFMVVLNEGKPSRYKLLKEWVLDHNEEVEVYGQWSDNITDKDSRFKGSLHIDEIQRKLKNVRATFIIPIAPGWVTSKYIEMIQAGVVPFFHPTYDEQNHTQIPEFFRPKTPEELQKRVEALQNDDVYSKYIKFLTHKYLTDDVYSGKYINEQIMTHIIDEYTIPDLSKFTKKEGSSLESFFTLGESE